MAFQSTTGVTGVLRRENGRWRAQARFNKQVIYLGEYASKEEAIIARVAAERTIAKISQMKGPANTVLPCNQPHAT
jgi:hypothetical protein